LESDGYPESACEALLWNQQVTGAYNLAAKREALRIAQASHDQQVTAV
jgi:hypothetical protein